MRLLIVTQKVDRNDPILGFFHRWIEEFAKHCQSIVVICLKRGEYALPSNVRVLSLGKEDGISRLKYLGRFYTYIWQERANYDSVFVHMNEEYMLLAGWWWRLLGKKACLWRNHFNGTWRTVLAVLFSSIVFCTSRFSYTARFAKAILMPVGIDTELFRPDTSISRKPGSILFVGRIAPVKRPEMLLEALIMISDRPWTLTVVGDPGENDSLYYEHLQGRAQEAGVAGRISFKGGIPNTELPGIYTRHVLSVNLSPDGMYDKTIFEAMACETPVLVTNANLEGEIRSTCVLQNADIPALAERLRVVLTDMETKGQFASPDLREYVIEKHSLNLMITRCLEKML